MKPRRAKSRDDREYDTTQLKEGFHAGVMGRDYSAHFFRWSFARRLILHDDDVLEVGCGQDQPLSKILVRGPMRLVRTYTGVDLNPLKPSGIAGLEFKGEFNFPEQYEELLLERDGEKFDVVIHLEVIEHMKVKHGLKLLKGCFECLRPGGVMVMSTPCYDGKRHAANHIHEYTIEELQEYVEEAGFKVEDRFGTFMDIRHIGKARPKVRGVGTTLPALRDAINLVYGELINYYDRDALSCFFAPMYPDVARNNLWICRRP
jgi:2-polyprenyl-3-methyl-5-hydroxy-6-metoxy-1,4-benzoquinol methylase